MALGGKGLTDQSIATARVDETTDQIHEQTGAILTLSSVGGTLDADGTVQTLYIDDEPLGCWKPLVLYIDLDEMAGGDTVKIWHDHRINDTPAALKCAQYWTYTGADGGLTEAKMVALELHPNRHGFRITFQQSAGTNRDYPWELFMEI
jgi:hypothetical protein